MGTSVRSKIDSWRVKQAAGSGNGHDSEDSAPKLAVLVGTEKQIAWAEDIRKNFLNTIFEKSEKTKKVAQRRGAARGYSKDEVETAANAVNEYYGLLFSRVEKASAIITASRSGALSVIYENNSMDIALEKPAYIQKRIERMKKGEFDLRWLNDGWSFKE